MTVISCCVVHGMLHTTTANLSSQWRELTLVRGRVRVLGPFDGMEFLGSNTRDTVSVAMDIVSVINPGTNNNSVEFVLEPGSLPVAPGVKDNLICGDCVRVNLARSARLPGTWYGDMIYYIYAYLVPGTWYGDMGV